MEVGDHYQQMDVSKRTKCKDWSAHHLTVARRVGMGRRGD
jgi:hypothetical protein